MHGLVPKVKLTMPPTWRQFPLHTLWALRLKLLGAGEHRRAELVQRRIQKLLAREARRSTTQPNRRAEASDPARIEHRLATEAERWQAKGTARRQHGGAHHAVLTKT
jgi:uncharacterized membrane protein YdbT with pleckstrin-like domain